MIFQIHKKSGNVKEAGTAIERALKIDPGNKFYYTQKLSLRVNEKNLDSKDIKEIVDISKEKNPHLVKLYADQLKKEGNINSAIEAYKTLILLDDDEFNRKGLAYLYYKDKQYSKAFNIFMSLSETYFLDRIFLSTIIKSAVSKENRKELIERMIQLANKSSQYKHLWGKIKKLDKDTEDEENK